jgi:hypothetical protein
MPMEIIKRRFTADDYQRMGQSGILSEDDRVELIDGERSTLRHRFRSTGWSISTSIVCRATRIRQVDLTERSDTLTAVNQ